MNLTIHESGNTNAPAIIFLHGLGVSSWMWVEQTAELSKAYHCIAVDLPGSGESYQAEWRSMADSAAQVADIIRAKATGKTAHVVGLSLGGYVGLNLLAQHPEVVNTMIVSGITTRPFKPQWLVSPLIGLTKRMLRMRWVLRMSAKAMRLPDEAVALYERDGGRLSAETIERIYAEVLNINLPTNLTSSDRPLLVVAGDKEAGLVLNSLSDLPNQLPTAVAAQVPNVHHGWAGEAPDLFTQMIEQWITEQSIPPTFKLVAGKLPQLHLKTHSRAFSGCD